MGAARGTPANQTISRLVTLKRRADYLRIRKGTRCSTPGFVLEARQRNQDGPSEQPRFGFTVSRQVGGAVERNRIKRRLKAAVRHVLADRARQDFDYVLIARRACLHFPYTALIRDLVKALERVHRSVRPTTDAQR